MKYQSLIRSSEQYATPILWYGLSLLFLWFGFSQLLNAGAWVSWVPQWAPSLLHVGVDDVVILNGSFEVIAGAFLAIGIWARLTALVLAMHMMLIVFEIGLSAIGMRDLAIGFATLSLAATKIDPLTLDAVVDDEK